MSTSYGIASVLQYSDYTFFTTSPQPESRICPFSEFSIGVQQNSLLGFSIDGVVN
jgi:hypothetical protein